jgi:hypothetical protein
MRPLGVWMSSNNSGQSGLRFRWRASPDNRRDPVASGRYPDKTPGYLDESACISTVGIERGTYRLAGESP